VTRRPVRLPRHLAALDGDLVAGAQLRVGGGLEARRHADFPHHVGDPDSALVQAALDLVAERAAGSSADSGGLNGLSSCSSGVLARAKGCGDWCSM
jgi:hypothetical protein